MFECLDVWMCGCLDFSECLNVWMSECLDVWMSGCLDVWMSECLDVWISGCLDVWMSGCLDVWMFRTIGHFSKNWRSSEFWKEINLKLAIYGVDNSNRLRAEIRIIYTVNC